MKLFTVTVAHGGYEQEQWEIDSVWSTREEAEARKLEAEKKWEVGSMLFGKVDPFPAVVSVAPQYDIEKYVVGQVGDTLMPLSIMLAYADNDPATLDGSAWLISKAILEGLTERYMAAVTDEERAAIKAEATELIAKGEAAWSKHQSERIKAYRFD